MKRQGELSESCRKPHNTTTQSQRHKSVKIFPQMRLTKFVAYFQNFLIVSDGMRFLWRSGAVIHTNIESTRAISGQCQFVRGGNLSRSVRRSIKKWPKCWN